MESILQKYCHEIFSDYECQIILKYLYFKRTICTEEINKISENYYSGYIPFEVEVMSCFKRAFSQKNENYILERLDNLHKAQLVKKIYDGGNLEFQLTKLGRVWGYNLLEYDIQINRGFMNEILPYLKNAGFNCDMRVLDIGCGAGQSLYAFSTYGKGLLVGIDISRDDLMVGKFFKNNIYKDGKITFTQADALQLPFQDGSFDFVFSKAVLFYLERKKAIREIDRVLASDGIYAGTTTGFNYFWLSLYHSLLQKVLPRKALFAIINGLSVRYLDQQLSWRGDYTHFETPRGLKKLLTDNGFSISYLMQTPGRYNLKGSLFFVAQKEPS
jgi:ubiquinone/menaquinone biosynthesis C-methylase UbiE